MALRQSPERSHGPSEAIATTLARGIGTYIVSKAVLKMVGEQLPGRKRKPVRATVTSPSRPVESSVPSMGAERTRSEVARFGSTVAYFNKHIAFPDSHLKMIARGDGVYHSPWAYHRSPSWASLHLDQTDAIIKARKDPEEYRYKRGIDALTDYGKGAINAGVLRRMREGTRTTILFDAQTVEWKRQAVEKAPADRRGAVANQKGAEVSNVVAAITGLGFNSDLEGAKWKSGDDTFQLVPYVKDNELHRRAAYDTELPSAPGLLLRTRVGSVGRPEDTIVEVGVVNIDRLRQDWARQGVDIPVEMPDPTLLAAQEYIGPGVLPSTQGNSYIDSRAV